MQPRVYQLCLELESERFQGFLPLPVLSSHIKMWHKAVEMVQTLRILVALPEDQDLVPNTHLSITSVYNCRSRGFNILSDLCRHGADR